MRAFPGIKALHRAGAVGIQFYVEHTHEGKKRSNSPIKIATQQIACSSHKRQLCQKDILYCDEWGGTIGSYLNK